MDWANLPETVLEKVADCAGVITRRKYSDSNRWLLTLNTMCNVCTKWKTVIKSSKLLLSKDEIIISFYEDNGQLICPTEAAKRLVQVGFMGLASELVLSYYNQPYQEHIDLIRAHAKQNSIKKFRLHYADEWKIEQLAGFLKIISASKPNSIWLSFFICNQNQAYQFWTFLMALITCCPHTVPYIEFDLDAPMCEIDETWNEELEDYMEKRIEIDWTFISNYVYGRFLGSVDKLAISLDSRDVRKVKPEEFQVENLNATNVSKFARDAQEILTNWTTKMRSVDGEKLSVGRWG